MSKYKEYIVDLADRIGKEIDEVTPSDIEFDFMCKSQSIWANPKSSLEIKEENKYFLPKIPISMLKGYEIGDVFIQKNILTGQNYYYLVV